MRIMAVKPSSHVRGRFLVQLENGPLLKVSEEELLRFGLRTGEELDEETLESLKASARASSVKAKAAGMLGSRPLSRRELEKRLVQKGSDEEDARSAADWLEDIGALDDAAYAAALVRHYGERGYGRARVREELRRRGVPKDLWEEALARLPQSNEVLDGLVRKKCRGDLSDPRERKRVSDALLRRGFSWEEVRAALQRYGASWEDLD